MKNKRKFIACFLLVTFVTEITMPSITYALTDGPSLPEASGFASADNSNLVDLFSGDFGYTIPLMDVGGYPITLSYAANPSMEQEASWVGLGWSLSPGSISRNLRGLPDDFSGENVEKIFKTKENKTYGIELYPSIEVFGKGKSLGKFGGGIFYNSYKGMGLTFGWQFSRAVGGAGKFGTTANLGINLNSQEGADINPSVNIQRTEGSTTGDYLNSTSTTTLGGGISTRNGLKAFNFTKKESDNVNYLSKNKNNELVSVINSNSRSSRSGNISFSKSIFTPPIQIPMFSQSYTLSFSYGTAIFGVVPFAGFNAWYNLSQPLSNRINSKAYGYLNEHIKTEDNALLDMSRDKDAPLSRDPQLLAVPTHAYDVFSISGEGMNGQFRAYRSDVGILHDKKIASGSISASGGVDLAGGAIAHLGANCNGVLSKSTSNKWKINNKLKFKAEFKRSNDKLDYEPSYFKMVTEQVASDINFRDEILMSDYVIMPKLSGNFPYVRVMDEFSKFDNTTLQYSSSGSINQSMHRNQRDRRGTHIAYFNNSEKERLGISHWIWNMPRNSWICYNDGLNNQPACFPASPPINRRPNQIGEFVITKPDGQVYTYGVPVYNNIQKDVSFAIEEQTYPADGRINYSANDNSLSNSKGLDNYYSSQTTPAYAHSFLLTSIASPDFVDRLNDGPTNDDPGKWVKFNYSIGNSSYKWRIPFKAMTANYNEGLHTDELDNKASYIYGEKELWNVHSIESRNFIAIFIVEDRQDGLPVVGESGGIDANLNKGQVRLKEISLYAKAEFLLKGLANAIPIKTVHFVYENNLSQLGYNLCKGVDNSINNQIGNTGGMNGKLTLNGIYFTYGKNTRGSLNQYKFTYSNINPDYNPMAVDRWGNYKRTNSSYNHSTLTNHFFPYASNDKVQADEDASAWSLTKIDLPTGGRIEINYESDDYSYVQDKRACEMVYVKKIGNSSNYSNANDVLYDNSLNSSNYWFIDASVPVTSKADIKTRYIAALSHLYFKANVDLIDGKKEFIEGYADIIDYGTVSGNPNIFWIKVAGVDGINPVTKVALQLLRNDLQRLARPNSYNPGNDLVKALKGLLGSLVEIGSFINGYEKNSMNKYWAKNYDTNKFWVKLSSPNFKRLGGGSRVKSIVTTDNWLDLTNNNESSFSKITKYIYTTEVKINGIVHEISSGVASYEPMLGGEENVFRRPLRNTFRNNPLTPVDNRYVEEPICEGYYPSASVGYSEVKVINMDPSDNVTPLNSGYSLSTFYTAKDYPTIMQRTKVDPRTSPRTRLISNLFKLPIVETLVAAQGYYIELNDMHGKPKSEAVYSKQDVEVSGKRFKYIDEYNDLGVRHIKSNVKGVSSDQKVHDITLGEDIDVILDMRDHLSLTIGIGGQGNIDIVPGPGVPIPPIVTGSPNLFLEYVGIRTAVSLKMINRSGILQSIESFREGAITVQENLAYDIESGASIVNSTKDEYNRTQYSVIQPAYWKYSNMGNAYRSAGINFSVNPALHAQATSPFTINLNMSPAYASLLKHGDILLPLTAHDEQVLSDYNIDNDRHRYSNRYWISQPQCTSHGNGADSKVIMDDEGKLLYGYNATGNVRGLNEIVSFKVVTSGNKNMLAPTMASYNIASNNGSTVLPTATNQPLILTGHKMINMSATEYNENWKMASSYHLQRNCTTTFENDWPCFQEFVDGLIQTLKLTLNSSSLNVLYHPLNEALSIDYILNQGQNTTSCSTTTGLTLGNYPVDKIYFSPVSPGQAFHSTYYAKMGPDCYMGIRKVENTPFHLDDLKYYSVVTPIANSPQIGLARPGENYEYIAFMWCTLCENECQEYVFNDEFNALKEGTINRWIPNRSWIFNQEREMDANLIANNSGGYSYISDDLPFQPGSWISNLDIQNTRWINTNQTIKVNKQGKEIEAFDALQIPSSSLNGYNGEVTVGVFKNAKYHETYFSSFEDLQYWTGRGNEACRSIKWSIEADPVDFDYTYSIVSSNAHTGKRSIYLASPNHRVCFKSLLPILDVVDDCNMQVENNIYKYHPKYNVIPKLFLTSGKKYLASVWVKKDGECDINSYGNLDYNVGSIRFSDGINVPIPNHFYPKTPEVIIDGWQLYEAFIEVPPANTFVEFNVTFESPTPMYIDDFRLVPLKAASTCYVYDPLTLKLMANLDDNHYATFYEYDDEGNLIRVKKETERGIMTVKEHRKNIKADVTP